MRRDKGSTSSTETGAVAAGTQRLDKWLWFARLAKTRTLASLQVAAGKIRVNRTKTDKPSQAIRSGDVITSSVSRTVRIFEVTRLGVRRGPPVEAQALYKELTASSDQTKSEGVESRKSASSMQGRSPGERFPGSGRPTKRDRRLLDRLKPAAGDG
jgi:ribosome-associated heat shock protein Hsp15